MGKRIAFGILGVVVGVLVGGLLNKFFVELNFRLHPAPEGVDVKDFEQFKDYASTLPPAAFLLTLVAHQSQAFVGSLVGTLVAGRRSVVVGMIVGALTLLGCVSMLFLARGPIWFAILDVLLPLPLAYLAARLVLKKDEPEAS